MHSKLFKLIKNLAYPYYRLSKFLYSNKNNKMQNIKNRSQSQRRLIKLEKIGFEIQATKLRSQYNNKQVLSQMRMKSKSTQKLAQLPQPQQNIGHFLKPTKIISVTAHKWAIYDFYSSKYIRGYRARDSHELSVFSKMLVFCAVNTIIEKFKLDMGRLEAIVTESVLKLHGHNCQLERDDIVSLQDLLSLMLIEQNQVYETILAVNIGAFMQRRRKKQYYSVFDTKDKFMKEQLKQFYQLVNSYCKLLKLQNIHYIQSDPNIKKEKNKCSASDVAILSIECLKIPLFMETVRKISHTIKVKYINQEGQQNERQLIINNKTIFNKYIPYLSVCRNWEENNFMNSHCSIYYQNQQSKMRPIVAVLLDCYGPNDRQKDIQQLTEWYLRADRRQLDIIDEQQNNQPMEHKKSIEQKKKDKNYQKPPEQTSPVKKSSLNKLVSLQLPKISKKELQTKVKQKLNTIPSQQITNRYDVSIEAQAKSKSIRIKTIV